MGMEGNLALQDLIWEEWIDGKPVAMLPRPAVNHNIICGNVSVLLRTFLKGTGYMAFGRGTDLYLTEKDRFVPDGMVVCDRSRIHRDGVHGAHDRGGKGGNPHGVPLSSV